MSDEEKLVSHYRLKTLLRRDGFGAVYLGEDTRDQKEYILRIIELDHPTLARITGRIRARSQRDHPLIEQIRQRMKRISELKNPHILPVIEFGEEHIQGNNDIIFYMVSPYEKMSLLSYWSEHTSSAELIPLEIIADLLFQAAEALFYVHKRGLVHQYVRLSSFMLRTATRGRRHLHLLLTDFWFADITAAILEEGQIAQDLSVYLAPEQLTGKALAASDEYTLAILAYELLLGYRLAQVDLSLGLYERFVRQGGAQASQAALARARRLDLVLARALAENAAARFANIEDFALTFRAVARGEEIELPALAEDTAKLPDASTSGHGEDQGGTAIVAAALGALAAGELMENLAEDEGNAESAESDEQDQQKHHPSLHKTVLTSEGMEATGLATAGEVVAEATPSAQSSQIAQNDTLLEEENAQASSGIIGATGFAAGLVAGEALQQETYTSLEQTRITESGAAAFVAGEATQREVDSTTERTLINESSAAGFAAGLVAGEMAQSEIDLAAEQTQIHEKSAAAFAAGLATGATLQQEIDISEERTQIIESGSGSSDTLATGTAASETTVLSQETDISEEHTQIIPAGGVLAAGAAAGESTRAASATGGSLEAGQQAGRAADLAGIGLAAGATGVAAGYAAGTARQVGTAGGVTGGMIGRRPRGHRGRNLLVATALALLLVLIGGTVAVFAASQSNATVTLTLKSHTFQNTYVLTAVTTSTTTSGQIQASLLTQSASQSKTGQASGYYSGSHASGFITFTNSSTGCGCPVFIPAGTAFTGASGVTVVTDTGAGVASLCTVTVRAHAVIVGPAGDIPTGDVKAKLSSNSHITATNRYAFSGGQNGQSNALVQQSDINRLASSLKTQVQQSAQASLQAQIKSTQHLFVTPICQTRTSSNHKAGDFASSVTVTVAATCTAEAYDYSSALQIIKQQVQTETSTYFSSQFVLVGGLQTTVTSATLTDPKTGTLLLAIKASGKWAYKLSSDQVSYWARAIAGQSVDHARSFLAGENGIAAITISISGRDSNTLPSDASKIAIVVKS